MTQKYVDTIIICKSKKLKKEPTYH